MSDALQVLVTLAVSESCHNFMVLKHKELQTTIAMLAYDKGTEFFFMAYGLCDVFEAITAKCAFKRDKKRKYQRGNIYKVLK